MTIDESAMLGRLVAQAQGAGADLATLRAVVEEASEAGAARALRRLGLEDGAAGADIGELRELLSAWRDAKRTARNAVLTWVIRLCLAALMGWMAMKLGFARLLTGI